MELLYNSSKSVYEGQTIYVWKIFGILLFIGSENMKQFALVNGLGRRNNLLKTIRCLH